MNWLSDLTKRFYEYTMTWGKLSRITQKRGIPIDGLLCHYANCRKPIEGGDRVISKQSRNGRRIYHKECYLKSFVA